MSSAWREIWGLAKRILSEDLCKDWDFQAILFPRQPLPSSMNTRANFPFIILIVTDLNMCERLSKLERKNICMVMAFALSSGRVGLQIYCHQAQSMLPLASLERITAKLVFNRNLKWQHETGDSLTDWICSP